MTHDSSFEILAKRTLNWKPNNTTVDRCETRNAEQLAMQDLKRISPAEKEETRRIEEENKWGSDQSFYYAKTKWNYVQNKKDCDIQESCSATCASSLRSFNKTFTSEDDSDKLPLQDHHLSEEELTRIMRKIDFRFIPIAMFVFFYNILDASVMVRAQVAGMGRALHMTDGQYHLAMMMYPLAHLLFAMPAVWMLNRLGSKLWMTMLVFGGGVTMLCTAFVKTSTQMILMRILIGILEAGLLAGVIQTITLLYPRRKVQWRIALAGLGAALASICGGFIAFAVTNIKSDQIQGWRLIFVVEGVITILAAPITFLFLPSSIEECNYLSSSERLRYQQMRTSEAALAIAQTNKERVKIFLSVLKDVKTWFAICITLGVTIPHSTLSASLPLMMVQGFHYSSKDAQVLVVPIKVLSAVLALLASWFSDRLEKRIFFVVVPVSIAFLGYLFSLISINGHYRYAMMFFADFTQIATPGATMIMGQNISCDIKRSAMFGLFALLNGFSYLVGIYIVWSKAAPQYTMAYILLSCFCLLTLLSCAGLFIYLRRENKKKAEMIRSGFYLNKTKNELRSMGDDDPSFVYRY